MVEIKRVKGTGRDEVGVGPRVLISEGLVVHAKGLPDVQNTPRKPRRAECMMTVRICEYHTEVIAFSAWYNPI